jgi:hypothetical protein
MTILDTPAASAISYGTGPDRNDSYHRILNWEAMMDRRRGMSRLQRYREAWQYYTGEVLSEGDYVQPLQINYVEATCEAHASYLWGQWEPQDRLVAWTVKPKSNKKGDKDDRAKIADWIDELFVGYEDLFFSSGLNQSIYGSCVLRPRWDPVTDAVIPESVLPEHFHCRWSAHDINDILDVIISYPIDREEAMNLYDVSGDPSYAAAVQGFAAKYAIYWEHWTRDKHQIWIDNKMVLDEPNPLALFDENGDVLTPGHIPFVHVPNVRAGGEFYGQSDIEAVLRLQDELNRKMADEGDIINYAAHPIIQVKNYFGKVDRLPVGPDSIWDMGREGEASYLSGGKPPVDIEAYVDKLLYIFQDLSRMPAAAFGRSETAQASALALAMEMMPVTQRVGWKRLHWRQGLIQYVHMAARVAESKGILPFALKDLFRYQLIPVFAPILPKDRSAQVSENVSLVSAGLRTIARALEDMGEKDAAAEATRIIQELEQKVKMGIMGKPLELNGKNGQKNSGGSPDTGSQVRDRDKG